MGAAESSTSIFFGPMGNVHGAMKLAPANGPYHVPLLSLEAGGELGSCFDSQKEGYHSNLIVQNQRRGRSLAQACQLLQMRRNILFSVQGTKRLSNPFYKHGPGRLHWLSVLSKTVTPDAASVVDTMIWYCLSIPQHWHCTTRRAESITPVNRIAVG